MPPEQPLEVGAVETSGEGRAGDLAAVALQDLRQKAILEASENLRALLGPGTRVVELDARVLLQLVFFARKRGGLARRRPGSERTGRLDAVRNCSAGERDRLLDDIAQLAHVSTPGVLFEAPPVVGRNRPNDRFRALRI